MLGAATAQSSGQGSRACLTNPPANKTAIYRELLLRWSLPARPATEELCTCARCPIADLGLIRSHKLLDVSRHKIGHCRLAYCHPLSALARALGVQLPMAYNAALLQPSSLRGASHIGTAAPVCRGAFFGGCQRLRAARPQQHRRTPLSAQAFQAEWPDPDFIKETKKAFPEKGVATVEEARVRCSGEIAVAFLLRIAELTMQSCWRRALAASACSIPP